MNTDPAVVAGKAKAAWDALPAARGNDYFQGTPMTYREAHFRRTFVEPTMSDLHAAFKAGVLDSEQVRLAADAALSAIPKRPGRRRFLTEPAAIALLFKRGIPCRSTAQVAAGAQSDLPWVGDIAADYGITLLDPDDDDLDDEIDLTDVDDE